jgi:hypothetical protein
MVTKKLSSEKNQTPFKKNRSPQANMDREKRIVNCMINTSIILMSTMIGAFTQVITNATGAMALGMAEALGGKQAGKKVKKDLTQEMPKIDDKMKNMISEARKQVTVQLKHKSKEFKHFLSDPVLDKGPKITEKYDFKLPRLTEELDDNALEKYAELFMREDPRFVEMLKRLAVWMNSLPKPPAKTVT